MVAVRFPILVSMLSSQLGPPQSGPLFFDSMKEAPFWNHLASTGTTQSAFEYMVDFMQLVPHLVDVEIISVFAFLSLFVS